LTTKGGSVAVACTGESLAFRSARPQDGWRLEGPKREGSGLEVGFESDDHQVKVLASCVGGRPVLAVTEDEPSEHSEH
jgi:hypothetical protein